MDHSRISTSRSLRAFQTRARAWSARLRRSLLKNGDAFVGVFLILLILFPFDIFNAFSQSRQATRKRTENPATPVRPDTADVFLDAEILAPVQPDTIDDGPMTIVTEKDYPYGLDGKKIFNPDPTRAVWMSALFPGLGQVYNRRYWKLPIIVAGFMGLGYGTSWNNGQFQDYSQAYRDILDSDPNTKSYMDFFPPTTDEASIDKTWLTNTMKSRKDYYRRNRDLCIICIVGLYLLCMVDAYVDASMAHFDISPNLSMDVAPTMIINPGQRRPELGLNWAFTF